MQLEESSEEGYGSKRGCFASDDDECEEMEAKSR
jgi:hypothetical protein